MYFQNSSTLLTLDVQFQTNLPSLQLKTNELKNKNVTAIASKTMLRSSSQKTSKSYIFQGAEDQAPSQAKSKKVRDSFFI